MRSARRDRAPFRRSAMHRGEAGQLRDLGDVERPSWAVPACRRCVNFGRHDEVALVKFMPRHVPCSASSAAPATLRLARMEGVEGRAKIGPFCRCACCDMGRPERRPVGKRFLSRWGKSCDLLFDRQPLPCIEGAAWRGTAQDDRARSRDIPKPRKRARPASFVAGYFVAFLDQNVGFGQAADGGRSPVQRRGLRICAGVFFIGYLPELPSNFRSSPASRARWLARSIAGHFRSLASMPLPCSPMPFPWGRRSPLRSARRTRYTTFYVLRFILGMA